MVNTLDHTEVVRKAVSERGSGGDDETLPACHTPQSASNQSLDRSRPLSCRNVSVKVYSETNAFPSSSV
ncbi:hypothetical protein PBY51_018086 [Eleginops maclovinus]|uniref:Uncharacterized protein n=1 Tax=Eleginops maclovinus TaxID=56733 RepID=A0AAN7XKL8_ELEMC|nr:hypothetical protein PBY51_018086 [Eleginops maclovinus]